MNTIEKSSFYADKGSLSAADICRIVAKDLKQRGYTHAKAAEVMRIDAKAVANQISGKRAFGKKAARLYAQAFGYSEPFLLHGEGSLNGAPKEDERTEAVILTQTQYKELIQRISTLEQTVARLNNQSLTTYSSRTAHYTSPRHIAPIGHNKRFQIIKESREAIPVVVVQDSHNKKKL